MSTLATKGRELEGKAGKLEFTTVELAARKAARLGGTLAGYIEPALGNLPKGASMQSDLSVLLPSLGALFRTLEGDAYDDLILALFQSSSAIVDGRRVELFHDQRKRALDNIDQTFGSDLKLMLTAAAFVVEVNFGDFIAAARAAITELLGARAAATTTEG